MQIIKKIDKPFLFSIIILVGAGFFIFSSASLGLLVRNDSRFTAIAFNQLFFGVVLGSIACLITSFIPYKFWKKVSLIAFAASLALTALVFVPGIGWSHGGAYRWVTIAGINFQPSEILKIGYIFYLAAVLSKNREKIGMFRYGAMPFIAITALAALVILPEPDNDTFFMIALAGLIMYFAAGARKRDIAIFIVTGIIGFAAVIAFWPYARDRVATFLDPKKDPLTSGYQIQQSLIAIGSGGVLGKGFGQSTQKYNFLPEPIGDSIFAVFGEEFGFLGSIAIITLFLFFALRGMKIAARAPDEFGRLVALGIVILIVAGSFMNIAAMLGIIPLTGTPLIFVSQGGTALFIALAEVGIVLNISKYRNSK
ncbi:MAG TPA: putative peptidoglycan glycosyltransferase FtsW [Candidatus Paceibacterota bacterium]